MVEFNTKIPILFFILSMILSVHALEISFLNVLRDFKYKTKFMAKTTDEGDKLFYDGTNLRPIYYVASNQTSTVIVHVVDVNRYEEIAKFNAVNYRLMLAQELMKKKHELIVLGIENCEDDEVFLINKFITDRIVGNQRAEFLLLEEPLEKFFSPEKARWEKEFLRGSQLRKCNGDNLISFAKTLDEFLTETFPKIEHNSKRLDPCETKVVRFYEYFPPAVKRKYDREVIWPVSVENGKYVPHRDVNLEIMRDNILRRYPENKMHILIVDGKEYLRRKSEKALFEKFKKIWSVLAGRNETLFLMGCFNFDWSDIELVPQIILTHSKITAEPEIVEPQEYKVFVIGIGMFATLFENRDTSDARQLQPTSNANLIELAKNYNGASRFLKIRNLNVSEKEALVYEKEINLLNGQYDPQTESDYSFSAQYPNMKFAFIVLDPTEIKKDIDFSNVRERAKTLKKNHNFVVFLLEAYNFKFYDLHIIPEWVERHRGGVHPDQIIILGCGKFDTSYQYFSSSYQVFYTPSIVHYQYPAQFYPLPYTSSIVPDGLKLFPQSLVDTKAKDIFVFDIDSTDSKIQTRKYPMHTINGFYDPVVLSNDDMIFPGNLPKILFLIVSANKFNAEATRLLHVESIKVLRQKFVGLAIYVIGLRNFGKNDSHLFAEFVKMHTTDVRPLDQFVQTFTETLLDQTKYWYKDTQLTVIENDTMTGEFDNFFYQFGTVLNLIE